MTPFTELSNQIAGHFVDESYAEGLALATSALADFPEQLPTINYWRMCFAARMNDTPAANLILDNTLAEGIWYSEMILRQSPSLAGLQEEETFERLVDVSLKMQASDATAQLPILVTRPENLCGAGDDACPAIVFLHGNQDSAGANLPYWGQLSNSGWLVALPQSRMALWSGAYAWADFDSAAEQIEAQYRQLAENYSLDPSRIVLGGFSMGAEAALALALSGRIHCHGFVLLGPGGPFMDDLTEWEALLDEAEGRELRGYVITGDDDDTIPHAHVRTLVQRLNKRGFHTQHETFGNLGHEYPANWEETLETALAYIFT
jgi:predicted esterase